MDLNPYHTSYGRLIKTKLIEEKIIEYLIKTDKENLNYEYYNNPGSKLIYITDCNDLEKDIPSFDQVFITQYNNVDIIATDLRK